jgi:hypothetical protein
MTPAMADEKEYTIKCRVTLAGADMIVKASSPGEALRKAKANDFESVEYDQAEMVDWEVTGTLPREEG